MPASLSFLVPGQAQQPLPVLMSNPRLNHACGAFFCHHIFSNTLAFCLSWQRSAQQLALTCPHMLTEPNHTVNSWPHQADFGPSSDPLDMAVTPDLPGTPVWAFSSSSESFLPLLPRGRTPSFLLWDYSGAGASCFTLFLVTALSRASWAGPQAWPRFTWMLLLPPAYLPSAVAALLDRLTVLLLFTC